jgi:LAGLIDADG endonuclease
MLINGEHLTFEGIEKLKILAKQMNTNRSFEEKWEFMKNYCSKVNITPEWIAGFVDGEGCFYFYIGKQTLKGKKSTTWLLNPSLEIAQNTHETAILELIKSYFNCGRIKPSRKNNSLEQAKLIRSVSHYVVSNMSDITNIIIPFFDKYSLLTSKSLDYQDWKRLIELKISKAHLNENGIEKMQQIKAGMNSGRVNYPPFNCCRSSHLNSLLLALSIDPKSVILNSCPYNYKNDS